MEQNVSELDTLENGLSYLFLAYEGEFDGVAPLQLIGDEVGNAETRLKRLKFGYLERETKDKFLRRVSDFDNGGEISEEAMRAARAETEMREADLDSANTRLQERVSAFELLASETTSIYEQLQSRMADVKQMLAKMEARRIDIDTKLKSTLGEDYNLLQTDELEKELDTKNTQLSEVNTVLNGTDNISETRADLERKVEEVVAENKQLESEGPAAEDASNPYQGEGQKLQLLCQLLREHLAGDTFSVERVADGFEITSTLFSLHIGDDDKVTLTLGLLPEGVPEPLSVGKLAWAISKTW